MKLYIYRNPGIIQGFLDSHNKVISELKKSNRLVYPENSQEPYVVLVRGLGNGAVHPDRTVSSYSDSLKVDLGDRIKQRHARMIPVKNIWFSWDLEDKAHDHRHPPQDEFAVSSCPIVPAKEKDVFKLFTRVKQKYFPKVKAMEHPDEARIKPKREPLRQIANLRMSEPK